MSFMPLTAASFSILGSTDFSARPAVIFSGISQEACATANDVKSSVSGARYYLLCEWLDMTPLSTAPTDIDEVIILRKAKRLSSNVRSKFGSAVGRQKHRDQYVGFLTKNPICQAMICRLVEHIRELMLNEAPIEDDVLKTGYF